MRAIKTILVPTDFNPASDRALSRARELADTFGATLHVLHVLEDPFPPGTFTEAYPPALDKHLENIERQSDAQLAAALTAEQKVRYSAVQIMRRGTAAEQILAYLNEHPIDLVVMGTAGRGGLSRLMIGSVADRIVRAAPCPVLTVHPPDAKAAANTHAA
jgi:nucleotide-binding universal stress UspA family protein